MIVRVTEFSVKRFMVSGLDFAALSKRSGDKLFQVYGAEIELKTFQDETTIVTTRLTTKKYRNGKIRTNAATEYSVGDELYILEEMRAMLDEIGDEELKAAFWKQVSLDLTLES